jgi:hypothetical protein
VKGPAWSAPEFERHRLSRASPLGNPVFVDREAVGDVRRVNAILTRSFRLTAMEAGEKA